MNNIKIRTILRQPLKDDTKPVRISKLDGRWNVHLLAEQVQNDATNDGYLRSFVTRQSRTCSMPTTRSTSSTLSAMLVR